MNNANALQPAGACVAIPQHNSPLHAAVNHKRICVGSNSVAMLTSMILPYFQFEIHVKLEQQQQVNQVGCPANKEITLSIQRVKTLTNSINNNVNIAVVCYQLDHFSQLMKLQQQNRVEGKNVFFVIFVANNIENHQYIPNMEYWFAYHEQDGFISIGNRQDKIVKEYSLLEFEETVKPLVQ